MANMKSCQNEAMLVTPHFKQAQFQLENLHKRYTLSEKSCVDFFRLMGTVADPYPIMESLFNRVNSASSTLPAMDSRMKSLEAENVKLRKNIGHLEMNFRKDCKILYLF
jgi:hypothetical protein